MLPFLAAGDQILGDPSAYSNDAPREGDLVLARHPFRPALKIVKRVARVVPDGGACVLAGTNPSESTDSRTLGTLSPDNIIGRVVLKT